MLIANLDELNKLLSLDRYYANGKGFPVTHLHDTVALSRWPYENIAGIYLTNPRHAWMAVWMAVTNRNFLRKRQLRYFRPDPASGDRIGRVEIYNPRDLEKARLFRERAYLYLFDRERLSRFRQIDISREADRVAAMERNGLRLGNIVRDGERTGEIRSGYLPVFEERAVIAVDDWQVALVNFEIIRPDEEAVLGGAVIAALSERATFTPAEVGEDYLV